MDRRSVSLAIAVAALPVRAHGALVIVSPPTIEDINQRDESHLNDTQKELQRILNTRGDTPFEEVQKLDELVDRISSGIDTSIERGDTCVSLVVRIPDLEEQSVEVTVGQSAVQLSYARQEPPGTSHEWRFFKPKVISLPLPEDADRRTARITRDEQEMRISFNRRS